MTPLTQDRGYHLHDRGNPCSPSEREPDRNQMGISDHTIRYFLFMKDVLLTCLDLRLHLNYLI